MNGLITMQSMSRQRLIEWTKVVLIVLAAAPPIGGVLIGIVLLFTESRFGYEELHLLPVMVLAFATMSYVLGLPAAVFALILFLVLQHFMTRGTIYLAAICGVVGAGLALLLWNALPLFEGKTPPADYRFPYVRGFVMFGIPAAISAAACWRMTRRFHRLQ